MVVDDRPQDAAVVANRTDDIAYWVQRTVREAIYGRVMLAIVLRRRNVQTDSANDNAEWEVTTQHCAVKEMSWQHIRRERDRLAEDPIKEVSAMQFLKHWHAATKPPTNEVVQTDGVVDSFRAILDTNIMMPLDLLSDDRHLYSVMPYCDGGELFERLDLNERFSEEEARYWMHQVLNVSSFVHSFMRSFALVAPPSSGWHTKTMALTTSFYLYITGLGESAECRYLSPGHEFGEPAGARVGCVNH